MAYSILFYGALGNGGKYTVGGGETGNYRTIYLLEKNGLSVKKSFKPYPVRNIVGYVIYIFKLILKLFTFYKAAKDPKIKFIHVSGFYQHLIYHEYLLIKIAEILKRKCVYELRGGGVMDAYLTRNFIYRWFFKATVRNATVVLCQGKKYTEFLKSITRKEIYYYPNYVLNNFLLEIKNDKRKYDSVIQLVYFGRIVESKKPELLLEICNILRRQGVAFHLEIIGDGEEDYLNSLKHMIIRDELSNVVKMSPAANHDLLKQKLTGKHFFLFPSNEMREGHSNALTEAMALGVVPVCSDAGFNEEIVNEYELVVDGFDPLKYASLVRKIWESGEWEDYSQKVSWRIKSNYTEQLAERIILKAYGLNI